MSLWQPDRKLDRATIDWIATRLMQQQEREDDAFVFEGKHDSERVAHHERQNTLLEVAIKLNEIADGVAPSPRLSPRDKLMRRLHRRRP